MIRLNENDQNQFHIPSDPTVKAEQEKREKERDALINSLYGQPSDTQLAIDPMGIFTDFENVKTQLEKNVGFEAPANFKQKHIRNVETVTGSLIASQLLRSGVTAIGALASAISSKIPIRVGGVDVSKETEAMKKLLSGALNYGGRIAIGSEVYKLLFGSNEYMQNAKELGSLEATDAFGSTKRDVVKTFVEPPEDFKKGTYTPESMKAAYRKELKLQPTVTDKLFASAQPFVNNGRPESEGPSDYYKQIDLKNRIPEAFPFVDEYNQFFGGAPSTPKTTPAYPSDDMETKRTQPGFGTNKNAPAKPTT